MEPHVNPNLYLGAKRALHGSAPVVPLLMPAHHLVTHGVVLGMTGSGKTGLLTVLIEEALRAQIPTLVIDVKGDLPNLLLSFPCFTPDVLLPWVHVASESVAEATRRELATALAAERKQALEAWRIGEADLARYVATTDVRVLTPGSAAGEPLHVLSSLERPSKRWHDDVEAARAASSAAISLLLRLLGRDADPAKSREHVMLSVLAEQRLSRGEPADLTALLHDLAAPPFTHIGALEVDAFMSTRARRELAAALNALLASPTFASWRKGRTLDLAEWLQPRAERTPVTIVSVAHLDDEERELVLGVLLEELLAWVRSQPASPTLRALVVFDEVYGFLPPHPANPPTKRPLVALMKQARAFGVGVVVATQNPMDLDYRALSNAGVWCIGRLQTDADRERVLESLKGPLGTDQADLADLLKRLAPRWFLMRDAHSDQGLSLLQPRWTMSYMRGPMTRAEIQKARDARLFSSTQRLTQSAR
jgi:hypothetical protein